MGLIKKFIVSFLLIASAGMAYEYEVAVCAIFQNEADYLKEWIDFHEKQGVEHFYLYNNLSTDNPMKVLKPYIDRGVVDLIQWRRKHSSPSEWDSIQCEAYMDCINRNKDKVKWCAFIDADEFLFAPNGLSLSESLKEFDQFAGVAVNWVMYGTSGVLRIPHGKSMLDALVLRSELGNPVNLHVKTIVQPMFVEQCFNAHFFIYQEDKGAVNENFECVKQWYTSINSVSKLRINHYWSRDRDYFYTKKMKRLSRIGVGYEKAVDLESQMNAVYDPILAKRT